MTGPTMKVRSVVMPSIDRAVVRCPRVVCPMITCRVMANVGTVKSAAPATSSRKDQ